jgi:hypothetical protein
VSKYSWIRKITQRKLWLWLVVLFFSIVLLRISFQYFPMKTNVGFIRTKQRFFDDTLWKYAFFIHVYVSVFSLIAGLSQFSKTIQAKYAKIHRVFGYLYVVIILFLGAPSGFVISLYANGGYVAQSSFALLATLWWITTSCAIVAAKNKDWQKHEYWMIRSYALTLSAVTLRGWKVMLVPVVEASPMELYRIVAWLSWTLNLCVAEIIIYRKKIKSNRPQSALE